MQTSGSRRSRAPYGRREVIDTRLPTANAQPRKANGRKRKAESWEPIATYYGLPAVKAPHYGWMIVAYFFIGGLASAAQFISTVIDMLGNESDRPVVKSGRWMALIGSLLSPALLIGDLHTPSRWYNMMRIFRSTSPMSIGAWALSAFGITSGLTWAGQVLEDWFGLSLGRVVARLFSIPSALAGGVVALYTGTLLAATSTPAWMSGFPYISSLFASSAASTAAASLTLAANVQKTPQRTRRILSLFALFSGALELAFSLLIERNWRRDRQNTPLEDPTLGPTWRLGVHGAGMLAPLALNGLFAARGFRDRRLSGLAALLTLVGGFLLRTVFVFSGRRSAHSPEEYFKLVGRNGHPESIRARK